MKLEERITILCAQALAADDEAEVQPILAELRLVLHHIEQLRSGLLTAFTGSMFRAKSLSDEKQQPECPDARLMPSMTWRQVVHEIAAEEDHERAVQLSKELNRLLQSKMQTPGQC